MVSGLLIFVIAIVAVLGAWFSLIQWREWRAHSPGLKTGAGNYSPSLFVDIDGFKIHYVQEGRGPDLLLVHGLGGSTVNWAPVFGELKKTYRVTALDLPGFGRSDKRLDREYTLDAQTNRLKHFITALKLQQPFVVGHSMGGAIATWLAKTEPKSVRKLLLLAPALNHNIVAIHPSLFSWAVRPSRRLIMNKALVRWVYTKRVVRKPPPNADELVDEYFRPYDDDGTAAEVYVRHAYLLRDKRLPHELENLATPAQIVIGQYDLVFPQRYLKRFTKLNPHIETIVVSDCGHQIMEEFPDIFLKHVREFLS